MNTVFVRDVGIDGAFRSFQFLLNLGVGQAGQVGMRLSVRFGEDHSGIFHLINFIPIGMIVAGHDADIISMGEVVSHKAMSLERGKKRWNIWSSSYHRKLK